MIYVIICFNFYEVASRVAFINMFSDTFLFLFCFGSLSFVVYSYNDLSKMLHTLCQIDANIPKFAQYITASIAVRTKQV